MTKLSVTQNEALLQDINRLESKMIDIIRDRLGIDIMSYQKDVLRSTVVTACDKFNCTPATYLTLLQTSSEQSDILTHLISGITVGETYFFRDQKQMNLLREVILPGLIARKREEKKLSLRIWSAGCATGEEIYTIALMLVELLPDIKKWVINLLGTDINPIALKKAILANYTEWSMRSIDDYHRHKYFSKKNNSYTLNTAISSLVKFDFLNLNADIYPAIFNGTNSQDLILCRNVLIYFNANFIDRLMKRFSQCLLPGGVLMLGASDPIRPGNNDLIYDDKKLFFSKISAEISPSATAKPSKKSRETIVIKRVYPYTSLNSSIQKIVSVKSNNKIFPPLVDFSTIRNLLEASNWQEILNLTQVNLKEAEHSAFLSFAIASALANLGKLEMALTFFEKSIKLNPDKATYFNYALTFIEMNRLTEAEKALRHTLFLDNQFVPAHYQLGLLLIRNKKLHAGLKSLHNAFQISRAQKPEEKVPSSGGLTYGRLAEIMKYELELYTNLDKQHAKNVVTQKA